MERALFTAPSPFFRFSRGLTRSSNSCCYRIRHFASNFGEKLQLVYSRRSVGRKSHCLSSYLLGERRRLRNPPLPTSFLVCQGRHLRHKSRGRKKYSTRIIHLRIKEVSSVLYFLNSCRRIILFPLGGSRPLHSFSITIIPSFSPTGSHTVFAELSTVRYRTLTVHTSECVVQYCTACRTLRTTGCICPQTGDP